MAYARSRAAARSHSLFLDVPIAFVSVLLLWMCGSMYMYTNPALEPLAALPAAAPTVKTIARAETSLDNGTASAIVWKSNFAPLLTPSTRRLLDGVAAWVLHRSIRWTWRTCSQQCANQMSLDGVSVRFSRRPHAIDATPARRRGDGLVDCRTGSIC